MMESAKKESLYKFGAYIVLLAMVLFIMVPLYWMVVAASIPESQIFSSSIPLIPGAKFLENFAALQDRLPFLRIIGNSTFIAVVYTLLSMLLCSMAGFAFAKYEFKFKEPLFYFVLMTLVLPIQALVVPLFLLISTMGLLNTFIAVILPWAANPLGIFLMRQNMQSIPDALLESARMDGATEFQIFYKIALPTMIPSLAALAVILFINQWRLFLYPLVVLQEESMYTIPVGLSQLVGAQRIAFEQIMVGSTLAIVPIAILFIFLQRYFIKGILAGSVKQ